MEINKLIKLLKRAQSECGATKIVFTVGAETISADKPFSDLTIPDDAFKVQTLKVFMRRNRFDQSMADTMHIKLEIN